MKAAVYNKEGKKTSKSVSLDEAVFGIEPNDHAIYLDVKRYNAAQRQGTHKSKERGEITGSTKKIKRQKGTGTARAGSIKNPLFKGGGTVFGPRPHAYSLKVNKKVKRLARMSALSYKAKAEGVSVLEGLDMSAPKTKEFNALLNNMEMAGQKLLMVTPTADKNVYLSSRNIQKCNVVSAEMLNTYDIMNSKHVVFVGNAHEVVAENLKK
ncbi:MAG: 50S ribosomal protein L4 [Flavobacteriales bacterium]|nr:50S ribosomal protein L4 [Flavobacteriales bacterium]